MYACNGILFNHESPVRGETFVTRKVTRALARIKIGLQDTLYLGNLNARRDWGHARDFVKMQWLMLQQDEPEDYVIATGIQYSVKELIEIAARQLNIAIRWEGEGADEKGIEEKTGQAIVAVDPEYYRPTEVYELLGDASKARDKLGWKPDISFEQMIAEMIEADMDEAQKDFLCLQEGFQTFHHFDS
jgi:GDPmannose 4,6-dehydratase